ncbi:hypothetical protein NDU88_006990 [Pleurodeles waltl]|uniref:Uncharacterized protein n=1 Tax=Pleurodeles waltl TaxID=8319 RepID=A0AAV7UMM9_PLEWA|nr:hypothetical protein NDU88_006990 [Pleurodeles waltl]
MGTRLAFPSDVRGVLAAFGAIKKTRSQRAAPPEPLEVSVGTKQGSGHPWRARAANEAMRRTVLPAAQSAAHRNTTGRAADRPSSAATLLKQSAIRARGIRGRGVEADVAAVIERAGLEG